jgi:hypothetical protein
MAKSLFRGALEIASCPTHQERVRPARSSCEDEPSPVTLAVKAERHDCGEKENGIETAQPITVPKKVDRGDVQNGEGKYEQRDYKQGGKQPGEVVPLESQRQRQIK